MRRPYVLLSLCLAMPLVADLTVAAEDVECTRYVAAVGKIIRVPCDDSGSPDRKGSESEPGPTVHLTPAELEKAAPLRNQLVQLSDAIKSAEGDAAFRDSYCTAVEMASLVRSAKNRRERKKLFDETIAMQARLGERGRLVSAALTKPVTDALLDTPINEAGGDPRLRDTPEGRAFLQARSRFRLSCACMREMRAPGRIRCCDSCSLDVLKTRF